MEPDVNGLVESITTIVNNLIVRSPLILMGLVVFIGSLFASRIVRLIVRRAVERSRLSSQAALAFGRMAQWGTIIFGLLLGMIVIFPSVDIATLLGTLGITSVAFGFAFRDVLQNLFAGLILLLDEPFRVGDQIEVQGYEGTVKRIETRATTLLTYDGRNVILPNAQLFINSVTVNTAHEIRRFQFDVGIGYGDDIDQARQLILEAITSVSGVMADPAPDVLVLSLGDYAVNLRARWWTSPQRSDALVAQDLVLTNIKNTLTAHGIDMPFPTQQILFHDQTEETDGDRARQREGWPAGNRQSPKPQRIADALNQLAVKAMEGNGQSAAKR